jgi:CheY-like chemotaxis protein
MMPELDGPSTLERLREAGVQAPVVFLTAKVQPGDRRALEATSAAGILAKPFDPMRLPEDLDRVLQEAP